MEFRTEELGSQPYLFIKTETKQSEIGDKIGACLGQIMPLAGANAAGAPFCRWHSWEGDSGVMEVGMPLTAPVDGQGDVQSGELPAGKAAVVTHVGSYEGLAGTWEKLKAWMAEEGMECRADPWEHYVDDPTAVPVEQLRTIIYWPIE